MIKNFKKYIKSLIREVIEEIMEEQKNKKSQVKIPLDKVISNIFDYSSFNKEIDIIKQLDNCTMHLSLKLCSPFDSEIGFNDNVLKEETICTFMTNLSIFIDNFDKITEGFKFTSDPYIFYTGTFKGYTESKCFRINTGFKSSIKKEDCLYVLTTLRDSILKEIPEMII